MNGRSALRGAPTAADSGSGATLYRSWRPPENPPIRAGVRQKISVGRVAVPTPLAPGTPNKKAVGNGQMVHQHVCLWPMVSKKHRQGPHSIAKHLPHRFALNGISQQSVIIHVYHVRCSPVLLR